MSKINIVFNNKNYNVDEASFDASKTLIRNHLSTVMSGSGATVDFGGTSYGVDSTKLSKATSDFVTHCGTIAGNGCKVMVNGVAYNVSSDKIADAVVELENILGGSESGNLFVFDGDLTNREYFEVNYGYMVHVSDKVLTKDDLLGSTMRYVFGDRTENQALNESNVRDIEDSEFVGVNGAIARVSVDDDGTKFTVDGILSIDGDLSSLQSAGLPVTKAGTYFLTGYYPAIDVHYHIESVSCLTE